MVIAIIVGTRPQIIKSVPIIKEAQRQGIEIQLIHTGQHYDYALSKIFFEELSPPEPFANLNVGSGSHVFQTAEIMIRLETYLLKEKPSLVIVPGDTNSALAGALASVKLGLSTAHLESGARSYDMQMAEEINRRLIDHCVQILFAPTKACKENLDRECVTGKIYEVGDTMYDIFVSLSVKASQSEIINELGLTRSEYAVLTMHRAENVDEASKIKEVFKAIEHADIPIIFPIHPRTKKRLCEYGISLNNKAIRSIDPVGYIEMLALLKNAKLAITDSGGLQKEAFWSKTPCITIRDRTEWMETVDLGVNFITDTEPLKITKTLKHINENYSEIKGKFTSNPYGDGKASERIVEVVKSINN